MEQNPSVISHETSWNNAGLTYKAIHIRVRNTNSGSGSLLADLQVDDVTKFSVSKAGNGYFAGTLQVDGAFTLGGAFGAAGDLTANNGTTGTAVVAYGTYTSATSYHRSAIRSAKVTKTAAVGASVTATALIPAGCFLLGVTTRVNTALGAGTGTTGYTVGDGSDVDLWGVAAAVIAGTATKGSDFTAAGAAKFYATAQDVVLTAAGGNFDGTGAIEVVAHYIAVEAD